MAPCQIHEQFPRPLDPGVPDRMSQRFSRYAEHACHDLGDRLQSVDRLCRPRRSPPPPPGRLYEGFLPDKRLLPDWQERPPRAPVERPLHEGPIPRDPLLHRPAELAQDRMPVQARPGPLGAVGAIAGPPVRLGPRHDLRPDGIQVDIPAHLQEIGIPVHQEGLVALFEHMAGPAVAPVEIARVAGLERLHQLGEVAAWRLYEEVYVIGQQTVAEQVHLFGGAVLLELVHVDAAVSVVAEHHLPVVPSADDVIDRPRILDAERSRHAIGISQSIHLFKPDPLPRPLGVKHRFPRVTLCRHPSSSESSAF